MKIIFVVFHPFAQKPPVDGFTLLCNVACDNSHYDVVVDHWLLGRPSEIEFFLLLARWLKFQNIISLSCMIYNVADQPLLALL